MVFSLYTSVLFSLSCIDRQLSFFILPLLLSTVSGWLATDQQAQAELLDLGGLVAFCCQLGSDSLLTKPRQNILFEPFSATFTIIVLQVQNINHIKPNHCSHSIFIFHPSTRRSHVQADGGWLKDVQACRPGDIDQGQDELHPVHAFRTEATPGLAACCILFQHGSRAELCLQASEMPGDRLVRLETLTRPDNFSIA